MSTLMLDADTERRLNELVDTTGKTPLEIVREALRAYREDYSAYEETA